jgi:hypothetical protein
MSADEPQATPGEQAVEILQTAAIEAIKAFRTFLDIAETVVREPESAAVIGRTWAAAAASALRPSALSDDGPRAHDDDDDEDDDEESSTGGVRRIHLSD